MIRKDAYKMYKVIIADDEEKICVLLNSSILWEELELELCCICHDGLELKEAVERKKPDILITDICMPGMNAIELIKDMREKDNDAKILIVSGYRQFEYAREAMRLHGFDYLLKPMPDEELLSKISDVIDVLDHKQAENFMFDSMSATLSRQKTNEVSLILLEQMNRGTTDFQQLNNSVFPFERTRNIRVLVVCFEKQKVRISTDELFGWLTKMLQQITYGYGSVYGFEQKNNVFVFLIQKAADSEELFSGVYRALEEMQSYLYMGPDICCTLLVSHQTEWEGWIRRARKNDRRSNVL